MTVGNATLAGVTLLQTSTSGFDRPARLVITPLLDDGTDAADNVVLQSSSLGIREAQIGFSLDDDSDVAALRTAKDALTAETYADEAGNSWLVLIAELTTVRSGGDLWACTARLILESEVVGS